MIRSGLFSVQDSQEYLNLSVNVSSILSLISRHFNTTHFASHDQINFVSSQCEKYDGRAALFTYFFSLETQIIKLY
jgi:hypothetical protein